MALNGWSEEKSERAAPVTLPQLTLRDIDIEAEAKEAAAKVAERKVIRAGIDAWQAIGKADTFEGWKAIGAALSIGKSFALRATGANAAWGRNYCRVFGGWIKQHHFDRMAKSVRSVAIELHENVHAIEAWRANIARTPAATADASTIQRPPLASRYSAN